MVTKIKFMQNKKDSIEYCILCGVDTGYKFSDHIDFRNGYVEGAGQLCRSCYNNPQDVDVSFKVTENFIKTNSNDQDLGEKIRRIYWKIKEKLS